MKHGILLLAAGLGLAAHGGALTNAFKSADGRFSFTVDCSAAPDLADWAETRLKPVVSEWYGRLADDFATPGYKPRTAITYRLREGMKPGTPGLACGARVDLDVGWIRKHEQSGKLGMIIHESWHTLQFYKSKHPTWLGEGICDWVRYYHYEKCGVKVNLAKAKADGSYGTTAAFLEWCRMSYGTNFVHGLIGDLRAKRYNEGWWARRTGRTLEELEADWKGGRLQVATYNIRRAGDKGDNCWSNRLPRIRDVILRRGFTLVGLQEAFPGQIEDLRRALPGWESFGQGRAADRTDEASPIFWNAARFKRLDAGEFWLSDQPEKPGSKAWRAAFPRICSWVKFKDRATGKEFFHFNTHLDYRSIDARRHSVELILRRIESIAGKSPVVLTGDFNDEIGTAKYLAEVKKKDKTVLTPDGPNHPINLTKKVLRDAREISTSEPKGTVWSDNGYGEKHVKRIDYIFVSDKVEVSAYETCCDRPDGKYPSDHEAVTATISIK